MFRSRACGTCRWSRSTSTGPAWGSGEHADLDVAFGEDEEREHIRLAIESLTKATGSRPLGWYTGRLSPNTRRLVVEAGGFLYDSDAYNDDLPYWVRVAGKPHLVIPYTLDNNDMKFGMPQGFNTGDDFFTYLRDALDVLYAEG